MNKEQAQWAVIIILLAGLVGISSAIFNQNKRLDQLSNSMTSVATDVRSLSNTKGSTVISPTEVPATQGNTTSPTDDFKVVTKKTINWKGKAITFIHLCKGTIQFATEQTVGYCLGENQLNVETPNGTLTLEKKTVTSASHAPVLVDAKLVSVENGKYADFVLLSYPVDACFNSDDCGAGGPSNFVTGKYSLGDTDMPYQSVGNYPRNGKPTWNPSATKAIFIPETCGGAGCGQESLIGYTLATAKTKEVTTEKAAGLSGGQAFDVDGKDLPEWYFVTWTDDSSFTATIKNPDGTRKTVSGKY